MNSTVQWSAYQFGVYEYGDSWPDVGGVYIFARREPRGRWSALYIGETDNLRARIPGHEKWTSAWLLGATHVHALVVAQPSQRDKIEAELIQACQPRLNEQLKFDFSSWIQSP